MQIDPREPKAPTDDDERNGTPNDDQTADTGTPSEEDQLDEAVEESFPASDPLPPPSRPGT